jgi:hypothetical protein
VTTGLHTNIDDPRFGRHVVTFVQSHARWINVGCPRCAAAPGKDCASMHRGGTICGLRYPVRPHRERRQLSAIDYAAQGT